MMKIKAFQAAFLGLAVIAGGLDASAQNVAHWSGAVAKVLPSVSGPAAGAAGKLSAFHETNDLSKYEHVLAPLIRTMQKQAPGLTPEQFLASPEASGLLAAALQERLDRARQILADARKNRSGKASQVADARDAESLILDSYPYLDAATLKSLGEALPALKKNAEKALESADLMAQRMAAESRRATDAPAVSEAVAETAAPRADAPALPPLPPLPPSAIAPAAPARQEPTAKQKRLFETVMDLLSMVNDDDKLDPGVKLALNERSQSQLQELKRFLAAGPDQRVRNAGPIRFSAARLLSDYLDSIVKNPELTDRDRLLRSEKLSQLHAQLEDLRKNP